MKIDCAVCRHAVRLTPAALLKLGLNPAAKVLDLAMRVRVAADRAMIDYRVGNDP